MTTKIEWCEKTWNPIIGCSKVSPGCKNCYAERMAWRLRRMHVRGYSGTPQITSTRTHKWTGATRLIPEALDQPCHADVLLELANKDVCGERSESVERSG